MEEKKKDSIYELDGTVPLKKALPLGIQHILAMFLGNVSPLIIVCGMLEMSGVLKMTLIQNAVFVAGIATLFQLYPFWKIGSGLPIVMGTSSGFIGTAKAIGAAFGYGALMGASFIGGIFEMVMGYFIKPLRKLFPPVVTSLVIISIGLSLLPVGINYFGGGNGAADFGSTNHLLVGTFVIIVILIAKQFKGAINNASILIGIVAGYLLAIVLGMVDFTQVSSASWFALPAFMPVAFEFNSQAIIAMGIMFIATTVETIGDVSGVANGGLNREATDKELQGGVMADGLGSILGAIFGVLPNTSFSQNVGLVAVTKVVNRFVIMTGAVFLILCGFCPKLSALFSIQHETWNEVIPGVFNSFGTQLLKQARKLQEHILILDEIGHLEQKETIYLETLLDSIDKFPNILGVLKKYDIQYIHDIAARKDVIVFDLDVMAYADVKNYILKVMGG